jgi:hypothetical protein
MTKSNHISQAILKDSIFIVGTVSSVEGRKVKVRVKKDKNLSHLSFNGKTIKNVSVGSYIKIAKGFIEIIGKVEGEYTSSEAVYNSEYKKTDYKNARYLDVSLFGHLEKSGFIQGIKEMPLIDNECYLLSKDEFNTLHQFFQPSDPTIVIGSLSEEPSQQISLSIRKLFASHIGIFGNTGSGKSNTLAKIYTQLFHRPELKDEFRTQSRFIFIDFNGEYTKEDLITRDKKVFNLTTANSNGDKFGIKRSNIERLEIISVLLEATEKTQRPFIGRAIKNHYFDHDFQTRSTESVDRLVTEILQKADVNLSVSVFTELFNHLKELEISPERVCLEVLTRLESGELKFHSNSLAYYFGNHPTATYSNSNLEGVKQHIFSGLANLRFDDSGFSKMKFKILAQYYHEIINGYSNQEHIRPLIGRMFKKFEMLEKTIQITDDLDGDSPNLEIVNLKDVNLEMKKTLPLMIVKQLYDDHKSRGNYDKRSLHIVIDEAHNILSTASERESETWKDYRLETFEEIIKEGRKFSTFLTISSQRPYDISATIISQLHNYFIHRLINDNDIKAIEKTIAYLDKLSFESIPLLSVGNCFVAGLASNIPVKVAIDLLPKDSQPKSETINLKDAWF